MRRQILALALIAVMPLAAFAAEKAAGKQPATLCVGEFARMLAAATSGGRTVDSRAATDALVSRGVPLGDLGVPLSERKLAQILDFYGLKVKSTTSLDAVSASKAEAALTLLSSSLGTGRGSGPVGASVGPAPQTLADCEQLSNHGQCVVCCKDLGFPATSCTRTCFSINKPSESEPLP
jgi:hypothetical protein